MRPPPPKPTVATEEALREIPTPFPISKGPGSYGRDFSSSRIDARPSSTSAKRDPYSKLGLW